MGRAGLLLPQLGHRPYSNCRGTALPRQLGLLGVPARIPELAVESGAMPAAFKVRGEGGHHTDGRRPCGFLATVTFRSLPHGHRTTGRMASLDLDKLL